MGLDNNDEQIYGAGAEIRMEGLRVSLLSTFRSWMMYERVE